MHYYLDDDLIRRIQEIGRNYYIKKIVLFGSRARGDHKYNSDIDLAVYVLPNFKGKGLFCTEIDNLNSLLKLDIVFINDSIGQALIENIRKDGVIIYERLEK